MSASCKNKNVANLIHLIFTKPLHAITPFIPNAVDCFEINFTSFFCLKAPTLYSGVR
jgi:hypothetical protein